jgi:hypothetical protein
MFTATGTGFTPNNTATSHLVRPDGSEFPALSLSTDGAGNYSVNIDSTGFAFGPYKHWAEDDKTHIQSNTASFNVTLTVGSVKPSVSISPNSGPAGTSFIVNGTGFTANREVTSHLQKPDGSEFPTLSLLADDSGNYTKVIDSTGFAPGTYQHWAIDDWTHTPSNTVTFNVTASSGSMCAHSECVTGDPLANDCSSCATAVCNNDSFCCNTAWDSNCVKETGQFCGISCQ